MKDIFGILSVGLGIIAYIPYFRDIIRRKTHPHPYSWLIWGLTSALIFGLQLSNGAGPGAYANGTAAILCLLVCVLAFRNDGRKYITHIDVLFFVAALVAALLWLVAEQPLASISLLLITDLLAFIPSVRKAWIDPRGETISMWTISGLRHSSSFIALERYSLVTILSPIVWVLINFGFVIMLLAREGWPVGLKKKSTRR